MSSSKRHKLVGTILKSSSYFSHMRIKEEVRVSDLVLDFPDNRKRIDWFIKDLGLVIEVHGEQHYKPVAFGGRDAKAEYIKQIHRDIEKQSALENAGYLFLEIPFWEVITEDYLCNGIHTLMENAKEKYSKTSHVVEKVRSEDKKNYRKLESRGFGTKSRSFSKQQRKLKSRNSLKKKET